MNGKIVIGIMALFVITTASLAKAQQPGKVSRVGYVATVGLPDANFDELRQGLRDLGHVEGKNITFEYRGAEGKQELIPGFVAELLQLKVDLLFCPKFAGDPCGQGSHQVGSDCHCLQRRSSRTGTCR